MPQAEIKTEQAVAHHGLVSVVLRRPRFTEICYVVGIYAEKADALRVVDESDHVRNQVWISEHTISYANTDTSE